MELISRNNAIEVVLSLMNDTNKNIVEQTANEVLHNVIECIHDIPTVEKRKEGHWVHQRKGNDYCSRCNRVPVAINRYPESFGYKYCPYCGAEMRGE